MTKEHLEEGEIAKQIRDKPLGHRSYPLRPKDFVAHHANGKWQISFTNIDKNGYELHLKRGGIREFTNLNSVESCLRRIGVKEFKVIL